MVFNTPKIEHICGPIKSSNEAKDFLVVELRRAELEDEYDPCVKVNIRGSLRVLRSPKEAITSSSDGEVETSKLH